MEQGCYYDKQENVIFLELAYYDAHPSENPLNDIILLSNTLPQKAYLVVNGTGVKHNPEGLEAFAKALAVLLSYVKRVVRYGFNDTHTRIKLRTEVIKQDFQNSKPNIFDTREQALAAIREGSI